MTPKEKAEQLVNKFYNYTMDVIILSTSLECCKQCALIAVDEIFEHIDYIFTELEKDKLPNKFDDEIEYWNEVKKEIELL
jgi:hypothetical protein